MDYKKLNDLIDGKKISKAKVIKLTGISRPSLDSILEGNDFKVSNLEKIAKALGVPVSEFFDSENSGVHLEGNISRVSGCGDISMVVGDSMMVEKVKSLEAIIAEKDKLIDEKSERILELKQYIADIKR